MIRVVVLPLGLTDPFKVTEVFVTDVAAEEVAAGATRFASVVNVHVLSGNSTCSIYCLYPEMICGIWQLMR